MSSIEIPIEDKDLDSYAFANRSSLIEDEEEPEESSKQIMLELIGHYLWDVIERELTVKQYQIFYLYHVHNFTQGQIATILQLQGGQAVIAQMLHICRARLRKRLGNAFESLLRIS